MNNVIKSDLRILWQMLRGRSRQGSYQQQLEQFYAPQASYYDAFRARLLHGRQDLIGNMHIVPEQSIVELGAGTGQNLGFLGYPLQTFARIDVVDLCPSLLEIARQRYRHQPNVRIIEADATLYQPQQLVDRVYFSYALTMIPNWSQAINNAVRMLKPGGLLGVVDFYVSADHVNDGARQHGYLTRRFWSGWFAHDGVLLNPEHLTYLQSVCNTIYIQESFGSIPYLPFIKAPYYIFVGQPRPELGCRVDGN